MTQLDEVKLKNAGLTVSRLVRSYKMAVDQDEQITILSDQTLIEPEHIVEILRENGVSVGKWHKRWTPDDRKQAARQMKKIQKAANKAQEQEKKSQEPEENNKEVKDMGGKRPYHRRSKQEIEAAKAAEAERKGIEGNECNSDEKIVATFIPGTAEKVVYGEIDLKRVPRWLYDLAETEYQLTKSKLEPYIKDFERMQEVEAWLSAHEAF